MLPSLESLHCFVEAARLLNFRAASRAVGLSPAALGQRIRQLEDQVGQRLFHRTTRAVRLTQAGFDLVVHAQRALDAAQEALRAGRGEIGAAPMELVVGTRHELGMSWVLPLRQALQRAHPTLTVHLYFGSGADLLIRVRTLEIDCAIGSMRLLDPRLDSIRLHTEEYVFVGSPRLLGQRPLSRREQSAVHTLVEVHVERPLYAYWRDAPNGGELRFHRTLHMGTIAAVRELVLMGEGVAVLPRYLVAEDLRRKRLRILFPRIKPISDHFRLIFRSDDPRRSLYTSLAAVMQRAPLR